MSLNRYRLGFDVWGLALFLVVMVPNIIWFAVPAQNDVLRAESVTPVLDTIASVLQVLTVACLCFVINRERTQLCLFSPLINITSVCVLIYYAGWCLYYFGSTGIRVILMLTVPPCVAFILFAADRKNLPAVLFASGFAVCHLLFALINFMTA